MIKDGIEYVKCNECNRTVMKFEMTDDCRMCKDCYIKWLEGQYKEQREQIENMKNCRNCANYMISDKCPRFFRTGWCKNWEMTRSKK